MAEAGTEIPRIVEQAPDLLHVTVGVEKDAQGHLEYRRFRVTGKEYERIHDDIVPKGIPREERDRILAEWVKRKFPYAQRPETKRTRAFNNYKTFGELLIGLKKGEIDGVMCMNSAAVLFGLLTRGKGGGEGYFYAGFTPKTGESGHAVVYDNILNTYIDPQIGVVTFDQFKNEYPELGDIAEDDMQILVPGRRGTEKIILAKTGEHVAP